MNLLVLFIVKFFFLFFFYFLFLSFSFPVDCVKRCVESSWTIMSVFLTSYPWLSTLGILLQRWKNLWNTKNLILKLKLKRKLNPKSSQQRKLQKFSMKTVFPLLVNDFHFFNFWFPFLFFIFQFHNCIERRLCRGFEWIENEKNGIFGSYECGRRMQDRSR